MKNIVFRNIFVNIDAIVFKVDAFLYIIGEDNDVSYRS
jgi:hypothetical protein